ncbi:hypothetical protein diail_3051 [Diaporthe ilicicola]|nr:hypothetical protein diail_3051 [Diaporthe ilicicola]
MRAKVDGDIACTIFQDGTPLPPTRLWDFLNHVWHKKLSGEFFWTDRLCLDQSDQKEIAQQVLVMGDIYSDANLVADWLEFYDWEHEAMMRALEWQKRLESRVKRVSKAEIERIDKTPKKITWWNWSQSKALAELECNHLEQVEHEARSEAEEAKEGAFHEAVRVLMRNPYWQRVWIVQEIVMAKHVQVMSRHFSPAFDELLAPFHTLREVCNKASDLWGVAVSMWEIWDIIRQSGGR